MAKTKSFKEPVGSQVKADKKFAEALLREAIDAMLSGDMDAGKTILRDYIKATVAISVAPFSGLQHMKKPARGGLVH